MKRIAAPSVKYRKTLIAATLLLGVVVAVCGASTPPAAVPPHPPTYAQNVAPILYQNCTTCHRPGRVAPFSLLTYQDAAAFAPQIAAVTQSRYMPPWKATPGYGDFRGARRLTDAQIAVLSQWAQAGAPAGDLALAPKPPVYPAGWLNGTPDLILKMPRAFSVPADGPDIYQCFVIPIPIPRDVYVTGYEFHPGNPKVVHHALFFTDSTGVARSRQEQSGGVGFRSFGGPGFLPSSVLGAWVPGEEPQRLPDGTAEPLRQGDDLVIQTHFHPTGKPEMEQSELGLYFSAKPPPYLISGLMQGSFDIAIPPGDKNYVVSDSFTLPIGVKVLSIQPHAHLLCRDMRVTATLPSGVVKPMIWIKDWDFNWQGAYYYREPVVLPKGTTLKMVFTYDNSSDNIRNPNSPPDWVRFGEQTKDEMALTGYQVIPEHPEDAVALKEAMVTHLIANFLSGGHGSPARRDALQRQLAAQSNLPAAP